MNPYTPGRLREAVALRDRDDVVWEIEKAADAWEVDRQRLEAAETAVRHFFDDYDADDTESANHLAWGISEICAALAVGEKP